MLKHHLLEKMMTALIMSPFSTSAASCILCWQQGMLGRARQGCVERNLGTFHMPVGDRQGPCLGGFEGRRQRCRHVMLKSLLPIHGWAVLLSSYFVSCGWPQMLLLL